MITSPLSDDVSTSCAAALQGVLLDLLDLAVFGKQAHWTVTGPRFREVHLLLDEVTDEYRLLSDVVAERIVTLGVVPDGTVEALAAGPSSSLEVAWQADDKVVLLLLERLEAALQRSRAALPVLEADPVSHDVAVSVLAALEKQSWMLQASR